MPQPHYNAAKGKVAIVTGASRGIGAAIARRLASAGASVACVARTLDPDPRYEGCLAETVETIRASGGTVIPIQANLAEPEDRARLVAETVAAFGPVDILINNAAVTWLIPAVEFPKRRFDAMINVQVWAPYELCQLVAPSMRERKQGWIVNISSRAAINPLGPPFEEYSMNGGFSVYGLCKAALERFTTGMAAEWYTDGVAVNCLSPWAVVPTSGATAHDLVDTELEPVEYIAEAALALSTGDPAKLTGRVTYSQPLLAELKRPTFSLDGTPWSAQGPSPWV